MIQRSEFAAGWRVLLASFIGVSLGVSSLYFYSLGIFIKPMQEDFAWTRADASLGAFVGTACAALMSLPVGWLADRFGSARVAIVSLALLAAGFVALGAGTHGLLSFVGITAAVCLLTAGSSPLPFTRLVVSAFERNRGIALGLTLAGTGVGAIIIPKWLGPFVAEHGWRSGYFMLAAVIAILLPLVWLLLANSKEATPQAVQHSANIDGRLLTRPLLYLLAGMFLLSSAAVLGTIVHFVPMLSDAGLNPARAGNIAALIGFAAIVGRVLTGALLDRAPAKWVTAVLFGTAAVGLLALGNGGGTRVELGAIVLGLAIGSEVDLLSFLVARYFPFAIYGRAYGAAYTAFLIGGAVGPYVAGRLFDQFGGYSAWLYLAAGLLGLSAGLAVLLPRRSPETTP